jgi:hypothetical protein
MVRLHVPTHCLAVLFVVVVLPAHAVAAQSSAQLNKTGVSLLRFGVNALYNDVRDLTESLNLGFVATQAQLAALLAQDRLDSQRVLPELPRLLAIDSSTGKQDQNPGALLPDGSPAPSHRPEIGRTIRFGVRRTWSRR